MDKDKQKKKLKSKTAKNIYSNTIMNNNNNNSTEMNNKAKSQIIFVKDEDSDEIEEDIDPMLLPYESPKNIYEIIQTKLIDLKTLKQMKQSMLANDFWLPEFELNGGINALLKLLRSSKVPFHLQPIILDIIEDISHIYPLMIMNAPGSIKFILHNFHCENIIVRAHIVKVLYELVTYNSVTHEKVLLGLSAYEQFIYGKNTPAFTSILDLLTDAREERNEFAVENSIRFINAIIDTPASLLVRVQLRSHIKSLKVPYLLQLILEDFDSEDIKKKINTFFESTKIEDESFQDMNVNHIKDPTTLMIQMNKIFSTKSYHPIFLSIIHNLYITAYDKKCGKKQLNKIHKFLYKPEIPNLDSRSFLPPMGQHEDTVTATAIPPKKKKILKKKKKKSKTGTLTKAPPGFNARLSTIGSDSDSHKNDSQDSIEIEDPKKQIPITKVESDKTPKSSGEESSQSSLRKQDSSIDIEAVVQQNEKLHEENEKLKKALEEKESFIRERENVNLETLKLFKTRETQCKNQVEEVIVLFKKQIESYKFISKLNVNNSGSSNNLNSLINNNSSNDSHEEK